MTRTIRMPELVRILGRSESSIRRDLKAGKLPRPVRQGRTVGWFEDDIEAYQERLRDEANEGVSS